MGAVHIPIIDEDALDDLVTAVQALAAPSATSVAVDATGMDIITAENAQGALKQLDTAVDSLSSSLAQLEPKVIDSGSMNSINTSGMYYLKNAVTDKPNANGGMFICVFANATTGVGLYVAFVGTGQAVYHCNYSSGAWSSYAV